ncbi:disintegrin and metalloproteinase domain-containing protein 10-like [Ostrea edulis]|uniref:disintegrin and metalloproteinase domain-containing protein 10-like n=1 Tax=Ostrea edulis TaxID=37623 RepID=UPI0024AF5537|nr:disintegrin and metalloproteinase domain-containing protein 10-like [Ostrea edulis]
MKQILVIVLILIQTQGCLMKSDQNILNEYIRHYEELRYDTKDLHAAHVRAKRSSSRSLDLRFSSHGRDFHLDLYPSDSVFAHDHKSRHPDGESHVDTSFIYDGRVRGVPGSQVHGAVLRGIFQGTIVLSEDEIYFIEPSDRYFRETRRPQNFHSIIYREDNMILDPYRYKRAGANHGGSCGLDRNEQWMLERSQTDRNGFGDFYSHASSGNKYSRKLNSESQRQKRASSGCYTKPERTCNLYLRADPVLFNETRTRLNGNTAAANDEILAMFSNHVFAINQIYSNTKFQTFWGTTPGTPCFEGFNFRIQRTTIMTDESLQCNNVLRTTSLSFCNPNIDVSNFLNLNSMQDHDEFCLAFVFTYRDFSGGTLGLAWVGSPSAAAGGVCERYKAVREQGRTVQKSLNTGIVTLINYARRVPPRVSQLTFAHEVGHNFGSPHDTGSICAPGGDQGNFIMYASATKGNRPNNEHFSKCSRDNITRVLDAVVNSRYGKTNCFKASGAAFCGNGIVEEGEECDCGYEDDCSDTCCNARSNILNAADDTLKCTLKSKSGGGKVACSPSQGPCCSESCEFRSSTNVTCRVSTECSSEVYCSGTSAVCPNATNEPDMKYCSDFSQVCVDGVCQGSLCKKIGHSTLSNTGNTGNTSWDECYIDSGSGPFSVDQKQRMCYLACKQEGNDTCFVSADSNVPQEFLDLLTDVKNKSGLAQQQHISVASGTPCNNYRGYCDVFHRCRGVDNDGPLERLKNLIFGEETLSTIRDWIIEHWWAVMLMAIAVIILMGGFIKLCSVNTPSENPKLKKFRDKNKKERGPVKNPGPYYIDGHNKRPQGNNRRPEGNNRRSEGDNRRNMELKRV